MILLWKVEMWNANVSFFAGEIRKSGEFFEFCFVVLDLSRYIKKGN